MDAVGHAGRLAITEITHKGYTFRVIEIDSSERTGSDALSATDTFVLIDAYRRHLGVDVDRPGGARVHAKWSSALHARDGNV